MSPAEAGSMGSGWRVVSSSGAGAMPPSFLESSTLPGTVTAARGGYSRLDSKASQQYTQYSDATSPGSRASGWQSQD